MKKILVMYATAGIGHKKASLAVEAALKEISGADAEVTIIDSLDYTNSFFKWSYLQSYLLMVTHFPTVWGLLYYLTDNRFVNIFVSAVRRINNWANSFKLRKYLLSYKPDVIVSTHFFASEVIADMKRSGSFKTRLITVLTDFRLHAWWVCAGTDVYVVGGNEARGDLLRWGVDAKSVRVLGIPVEPIFTKELNRDDICRRSGMNHEHFTMLVIGGGFGVGPIVDIVKIITSIRAPLQTIVVCGRNEKLVKELEALKPTFGKRVDVHGFVNNVHELMGISDLLISKSGGITVSESLARELPMVVIAPIIGQETRNCDFLIANGAAVKADKLSDLKAILEYLVNTPAKMKDLREAIVRIRKPSSCYDIARLALEECNNG